MQIDSLKSSITTLKKLRDAYHSQLDAIVLDELDGVIAELTRHSDKQEKEFPKVVSWKSSLRSSASRQTSRI